jgi:hypothetical protein
MFRVPAVELATVRLVSGSTWSVEFRDHRKKKRFTVDAVTCSFDGKLGGTCGWVEGE